jgi:hypothetical protein
MGREIFNAQNLERMEVVMSTQQEKPAPQPNQSSERQTEYAPVLAAQDARQGETGDNVRYVLGFGLFAVVVAFFAIYLVYFA